MRRALGLIALLSAFGAALVGVSRIDQLPPVLRVDLPAPGEVAGAVFVVRGEVTDASPVELTVDGELVSSAAGPFEVRIARAALGPTEVVLVARDARGYTTRQTLAVTCREQRAALELTTPLADAALPDARVEISGRLRTNGLTAGWIVRAGETELGLADDGTFTGEVLLRGESPWRLEVSAEAVGSALRVERVLELDEAPPRLEPLRPTCPLRGAQARIAVRVHDAAPWVDVTCGEVTRRVPRGELFSAVVPVGADQSRLEVSAVDAARHTATPVAIALRRLPEPISVAAFRKRWHESDPATRVALVERLDPADPRRETLPDAKPGTPPCDATSLLTEFVLKTQDWYLRCTAIDVLASHLGLQASPTLEAGARGTDGALAGGLLHAYALAGDPAAIPLLISRLDGRWSIAREAAEALGRLPDRRALPALIVALWRGDPQLEQVAMQSLETITRHREPNRAGWTRWWQTQGAGFDLATTPPALPREGDRLWVHAAGVLFEARLVGDPAAPPVFVLPELGLATSYLEDALRGLEAEYRLVYVTLPGPEDFAPPLRVGAAAQAYPTARFVEGLAGLHAALLSRGGVSSRPISFVADGTAGWLAIEYARRFPSRVLTLALQSTPPDRAAWDATADRREQRGQQQGPPWEQLAERRRQPGRLPEAGPLGVETLAWTYRHADTRSLAIGQRLGPQVTQQVGEASLDLPALVRPLLGCAPPAFDPSGPPPRATSLLLRGVHDEDTPKAESERLRAWLNSRGTRNKTIELPRSASLPLLEEERARQLLRRWLRERVAESETF